MNGVMAVMSHGSDESWQSWQLQPVKHSETGITSSVGISYPVLPRKKKKKKKKKDPIEPNPNPREPEPEPELWYFLRAKRRPARASSNEPD
jgi:hypothetical protein